METVQADQSSASRLPERSGPAVTLKGSVFTLPILKLSSTDLDLIENELNLRLSTALDFFKNAPVVIDLEQTQDAEQALRFSQLEALLRKLNLVPVGVQNGSAEQNSAAINSGFAILTGQTVDRVVESRRHQIEETPEESNDSEEIRQGAASI
ncbi:MAG: hypothetical protein OEY58_13220, partial [Gammaproteobacteria bacterium]|nr:hypothetical protein [Gammaproteobacteria bacterium]